MKILVLSDSHSGLSFMLRCVGAVRPDWVVHLGDYYEDGQVVAQEFPAIPTTIVPGNCDRFRCIGQVPEIFCFPIGGAMVYMTHGHRHGVKSGTEALLRDARAAGASAVLYGHTHRPDCHQEADGLWVLNPGSCGYYGGSAGLMTVEQGKVVSCRILRQTDLEEKV